VEAVTSVTKYPLIPDLGEHYSALVTEEVPGFRTRRKSGHWRRLLAGAFSKEPSQFEPDRRRRGRVSPGSYVAVVNYNCLMARGWESKSVEQQQEDAAHDKEKKKAPMSEEQIAEEKRREGIELSRQHILQQLQVACNPRHRAMLERALADLNADLE
jgi:hypothetical protein